MTLVDTNVLLDIATNDPSWVSWYLYQLDAAAIRPMVETLMRTNYCGE
jgi:hypothetical protein